jgi:CIC family chloride channel protein
MSGIRYKTFFSRLPQSISIIMVLLSILIGSLSGAGVWVFKQLINLVQNSLFNNQFSLISPLGSWTVVIFPILGGVTVAILAKYFIGAERFRGVAGVMESAALFGGRLNYKTIPIKTIASAISIGAGASVGPEDPSVQIGANIGSFFGQKLHLSDDNTRTLVAVGSAAAIAAAFNAPIAGVFFSLEIILGEITGTGMGLILIGAVVSAIFTQAVSGAEPAFHVPAYAFHTIAEIPLYVVLGAFSGPIAALYIRLIFSIQSIFSRWKISGWLKTGFAGLMVGITGIFLPQIFGVGYGTINSILNQNNYSIFFLLTLLIAKLILTPVSVGGGFMGGVFAPSLFLGAALGGAYGLAVGQIVPDLGVYPSAFALVGMAAVLAGVIHAPLTATILLFEMTNDYRIILPLMFAVAISYLTSQRLQHNSVYMTGLIRRGIHLDLHHEVDILQTITVGEVMGINPVTIHEDESLSSAYHLLQNTHLHGLPVIDTNDELTGVITIQDIERIKKEHRPDHRVMEVYSQNLQVAYPGELLNLALLRMSQEDIGRLPVVDRSHPRKLLGILMRSDIIHAYDLALKRRTSQRHQVQMLQLDTFTKEKVKVMDVVVEENSSCANKRMMDIAWPEHCLVASVQRNRQIFIPHGDTILEPGDILVLVTKSNINKEISHLCQHEDNTDIKPFSLTFH